MTDVGVSFTDSGVQTSLVYIRSADVISLQWKMHVISLCCSYISLYRDALLVSLIMLPGTKVHGEINLVSQIFCLLSTMKQGLGIFKLTDRINGTIFDLSR